MRLVVNGVEEELAVGNVAELLRLRGTDPRWVVVALNQRCILRRELAVTMLQPHDVVEILSPMQGG